MNYKTDKLGKAPALENCMQTMIVFITEMGKSLSMQLCPEQEEK